MATYYVDSNAAAGGTGTSPASPLNTLPVLASSDVLYVARNSVFTLSAPYDVPPGASGSPTKMLAYGSGKKPVFNQSMMTSVVLNAQGRHIELYDLYAKGGRRGFNVSVVAATPLAPVKMYRCEADDAYEYGFVSTVDSANVDTVDGVEMYLYDCVSRRARLGNYHAPGAIEVAEYERCKSIDAGLGWPYFANITVTFSDGTTSAENLSVGWGNFNTNFANQTYSKTFAKMVTAVTCQDEYRVKTFTLSQAGSLGSGLAYLQFIQVSGVLYVNIGTSNYCGAHGFTTIIHRNPVTASGWVNTSGSVWSYLFTFDLSIIQFDPNGGTGVTNRNLPKTAGDQTLPNAHEFGQVGRTIYVNIPGGWNPNTIAGGVTGYVTFGPWGYLKYTDCLAVNTRRNDPTGSEGHGFAADDYSTNVTYTRCVSFGNVGIGFSGNKGVANSWFACLATKNWRGAALYYSKAHNVVHCTFAGNADTDWITDSGRYTNLINNVFGKISMSAGYTGMNAGADNSFGNVSIAGGYNGLVNAGWRAASGLRTQANGGLCMSADTLTPDNPYLDTTDRVSGYLQTIYSGTDLKGKPFSDSTPSPGCVQYAGSSPLTKSPLFRGHVGRLGVPKPGTGVNLSTPFFSALSQFTIEIVYLPTHRAATTQLLGYATATGTSLTPSGLSLSHFGSYGPRFGFESAGYQYVAILNAEQTIQVVPTGWLTPHQTTWKHLVVRVDFSQASYNEKVRAWGNGIKSVGPYWEGRLLTNYAVAIYPPTTTAYPVVGTTLTVPSLNCLLNHTSNIDANDSQIALVRVWPTALNDAQCGAAYKRYIRGWSAEVTPPLEFTFSSSGPSTNSGSDPSVVASLVGSPLFV